MTFHVRSEKKGNLTFSDNFGECPNVNKFHEKIVWDNQKGLAVGQYRNFNISKDIFSYRLHKLIDHTLRTSPTHPPTHINPSRKQTKFSHKDL